jgi:hypothetical protein
MPAHIYVSYSYLDTKMAMAVADGLRKLGHTVTIAQEAMAVGGHQLARRYGSRHGRLQCPRGSCDATLT